MNRPYIVYINGQIAERRQTLKFAIRTALRFFPSYIVDSRINAVVWTGAK